MSKGCPDITPRLPFLLHGFGEDSSKGRFVFKGQIGLSFLKNYCIIYFSGEGGLARSCHNLEGLRTTCGSVLSCHLVPRDLTRVTRLSGQHANPLSIPTDSRCLFFYTFEEGIFKGDKTASWKMKPEPTTRKYMQENSGLELAATRLTVWIKGRFNQNPVQIKKKKKTVTIVSLSKKGRWIC